MKTVTAELSVANPNRDGTGTLVNLVTGTTNGIDIQRVIVTSPSATTDGMIRFFIYDGSTNRLVSETSVFATTPSSTTKAFSTSAGLSLFLEQNQILKASTEKAETFNVIISYIEY